MTGGASGCQKGLQTPGCESLGLRHVSSGHRAQEAGSAGTSGWCRQHPEELPHFPRQVHRRPSTRRRAPVRPRAPLKRRPALGSPFVTPSLAPLGCPTPLIVPPVEMSELRKAAEDLQDPRDSRGLMDVQQMEAEQEGGASPWSSSSSVSSSYSACAVSLLHDAQPSMVTDLVGFLLLKYHRKQPTTRAEMLSIFLREYQHHFPAVFSQASEYMQLVFGVDVKEVDPGGHWYVLVPTLGLTCDGMLGDGQSMPKNGLLVMLLCMIHLEGERLPEEEVWGALSKLGLRAGREHFIYGEPRELITKAWVQEGYLEYRQVANSDPARFEFLWGPRAHAEISKLQVLEHVHRASRRGPSSFPSLSDEAASDEEEEA
ncbi:melanoma-associated antigen 8 isoform X4 [Camelus ferus]|uniref:Melanoma-associated antigen 8 isoform X4 n=8 Tax=Camelus TaxID=9836 RepID=A0A8B8SKC9_CAMFR|nr:melanoma-associated antigen 8-like isoform X4 [Camelus ferus]XP_032330688.1 melanoma-associated antigen 8 isoform X4 [Camelus ferus]